MQAHGYIQGCSALHTSGLYTALRGQTAWNDGQRGPLDVKRSQVMEQPLPEFGKLQCPDKLAFSAASMLFNELSEIDRTDFGICLGSVFGSLSTDIRYMESLLTGFPRPAYFSATLPSSPVAEVAIRFRIKGPNRVVCGGACPGLSALDCAFSILQKRKAPAVLIISLCAIDDADIKSSFIPPMKLTGSYAYACLISDRQWMKGINRPIEFKGDFRDDGMAEGDDESYFLEIVKAVMRGENRSITISSPGFQGSLSIEKG